MAVANEAALANGVRPGMTLAAAYALVHTLRVRQRDPLCEADALRALAAWAGQFTPNVTIEDGAGLLLEVSGSLKLFGGIAPILRELRSGCSELGFTAALACAATARAAWWLARSGKETIAAHIDELPAKLAALSIDALGWPPDALTTLHAIGINTVGEAMALPRDGFARRFGQRLLDQLDQARGRLPDPRPYFVPPEQFRSRLELPAAVEQASALLFATRRLLVELGGFLRARASGVQQFQLRLEHDDPPASTLTFNLVAPGHDEAHLALLVRERFDQHALRAPVYQITLEADVLIPLAGASLTLFDDRYGTSTDWTKLVERLRARLGSAAVHGLTIVAEHRPEYAVRPTELTEPRKTLRRTTASPGASASAAVAAMVPAAVPTAAVPTTVVPASGTAGAPAATANGGAHAHCITAPHDRPLWLLVTPQPLVEVDAKPYLRGPLALVAGPERIESGWWDGHDVRRDYFIAQDIDRSLLWVYRDPAAAGWFLHGLFA